MPEEIKLRLLTNLSFTFFVSNQRGGGPADCRSGPGGQGHRPNREIKVIIVVVVVTRPQSLWLWMIIMHSSHGTPDVYDGPGSHGSHVVPSAHDNRGSHGRYSGEDCNGDHGCNMSMVIGHS